MRLSRISQSATMDFVPSCLDINSGVTVMTLITSADFNFTSLVSTWFPILTSHNTNLVPRAAKDDTEERWVCC